MGYLAFAIIVIGIILIIVAPINKRKNNRCSAQTQGRLINIIEREDSDGPLPSMYVYSYFVNGIEYQIKSAAVNKNVNSIGDVCPIWYNPAKPKEAQEFRYASNKVFTIILIIGIALVVLGIVLAGVGCSMSITQELSS